MAARGQSLAERFSRWQVLVNNLRDAEGFAHVGEELATLDRLLGEARALENRKDELRSQVRAINAQLLALARNGDGVRSRVGSNLHGKFGTTSEELIRYGFEPRRVTRRRSKREIELERAAQAVAEAATDAAQTQVPAEAATPAGTEA
jgi:hypothetical protein